MKIFLSLPRDLGCFVVTDLAFVIIAHFDDLGSDSDHTGSSRPLTVGSTVLRRILQSVINLNSFQHVFEHWIRFGIMVDASPEFVMIQYFFCVNGLLAPGMQFSLIRGSTYPTPIHGVSTIGAFVDVSFLSVAHLRPMTMNLVYLVSGSCKSRSPW